MIAHAVPTAPPVAINEWSRALTAGLAAARTRDGLSFIALPAPVVEAPPLLAAWPAAPAVSWSRDDLTIVGIGIARELRGHGADRWAEVIAAADRLAAEVATPTPPGVRPRVLGGAAFAPGTADRAPWSGFGDAWFVLPRWTYMNEGGRAHLLLAVDRGDAAATNDARWHAELATHATAIATRFVPRARPPVTELVRGDATAWHALVDAIVAAIATGDYAKVVAAHRTEVVLGGELRVADLLAALDERQPDSVRVVVRPPDSATLIAATPERLVTKRGAEVACDALAGSIACGEHAARDLLASTKDGREHQLVVTAITEALGALGKVDAPAAPVARTLRDVVHLHTPIRATLTAPHHLLAIAARLHPTPAVGGTPTAAAVAWIAAHERDARGWYASPVGWFDLAGDGELAVAIRSGVLARDHAHAHLWAGAGIVAGSDPARELAETEIKLRTMLGALGVAR